MPGDLKFRIELDSNAQPILKGIVVGADETRTAFERAEPAVKRLTDTLQTTLDAVSQRFASADRSIRTSFFNGMEEAFNKEIRLTPFGQSSKAQSPFVMDFDKEAQALAFYEQNARRVANIRLDEALKKQAEGAEAAGEGLRKLKDRAQGLPTALTLVGTQIADMGPASSVAAQGLNAMATFGATPLTIGMTALAGVLAFATSRITEAKNRVEEFKRIADADIDRKQNLVALNKTLEDGIRITKALDPEMERINVKYEELGKKAKGSQLLLDNLATSRENDIKALNKQRDAVQETLGQQQNAIQLEINLRQLQSAAIGQTGVALDALSLAQKLNAINTRVLAGEHGALLNVLGQEEVRAYQLKRAYDQISTGRGAISQFQQQFGVELGIEKDIKAFNAAKLFVANFNALKNQPAEQAALREAFKSFVDQALQSGVTDPQELLIRLGLTPANLERLKSTLSPALANAFKLTSQAGDQWGQPFLDRLKDFQSAAGNVGAGLEEIEKKINEITNQAVQERAITINPTPALNALADIRSSAERLRAELSQPIIVNLEAKQSGSPALPFSDYWQRYAPGILREFSGTATQQIAFNIPDFSSRLRQIADLEQRIMTASNMAVRSAGYMGDAPFGSTKPIFASRAYKNAAIASLSAQRDDLSFGLSADIYRAQQQPGGGGGSGGPTVVINIQGDIVGTETLDNDILPRLERTLIRATGQNPEFSIHN